jgi:DNA-binding NarL/FixJ family response regulator
VIRAFILARSIAEQDRLRSLAASTDIAVVGAATSLDAMPGLKPDVAILAGDHLPPRTRRRALPPIIIWTDDPGAAARVKAWGSAAWGVVSRRAAPAQLQAAVLAVANGLCVVPPESFGPAVDDTTFGLGSGDEADGGALEEPLTARLPANWASASTRSSFTSRRSTASWAYRRGPPQYAEDSAAASSRFRPGARLWCHRTAACGAGLQPCKSVVAPCQPRAALRNSLTIQPIQTHWQA